MRKTRQQRDQELRNRIAQAAGYKNHNDAVAKLKPAKVGEFYADYDGDTGLFCVFHTENAKAVASYSSAVEAEKAANDLNLHEKFHQEIGKVMYVRNKRHLLAGK